MRRLLLVVVILAAAVAGYLYARRPTASEAERNRVFAESMNGVTLAGSSTILSRPGQYGSERYRIESVSHMSGDLWLLKAAWNYHGKDITVPIPLQIKWAGDDTPVITLTDLAIPGVGTYSARVVLYRDQYAGTWQGKTDGGQVFGKIERPSSRP